MGPLASHAHRLLDAVEAAGHPVLRWHLDSVEAIPEDGGSVVRIEIGYRVLATNDYRNLVFPFYVIPHEEPAP